MEVVYTVTEVLGKECVTFLVTLPKGKRRRRKEALILVLYKHFC